MANLIAAHYGFHYQGTFTFYKPAYDPAYARITPGDVILKRLLEQARDESAALFDFTIGEESYKLGFATSVPEVISLHVTPSRLGAAVRQFRASSRRLLLSLQDRIRDRLQRRARLNRQAITAGACRPPQPPRR